VRFAIAKGSDIRSGCSSRTEAKSPEINHERRHNVQIVNPGLHAYMIVNVDHAEKAQINREESDLLKEVCAYRSDFCMDGMSMEGKVQ
jgi:hypothetical protein